MWNAGLDEAQAEIKIAVICRWHHPNCRKLRGTKEPLDKCEREWKSWLKIQHSWNWTTRKSQWTVLWVFVRKGSSSFKWLLLTPVQGASSVILYFHINPLWWERLNFLRQGCVPVLKGLQHLHRDLSFNPQIKREWWAGKVNFPLCFGIPLCL